MINVTRSSMPGYDEYIEEIKDIWDSRWLTNMGPKHKQFQEQLKDYLEVDNVDLFCNGHMALEMAIQAMGLTGEVITTPFTFASSRFVMNEVLTQAPFSYVMPTAVGK